MMMRPAIALAPCLMLGVLAMAGCNNAAPAPPVQGQAGSGNQLGGLQNAIAAGRGEAPATATPTAQVNAPSTPSGVDGSSAPNTGSAQRAAIMDAVRPPIERELGAPIEFVVTRVGVQDGWALVIANPQRPGGAPIPIPARYNDEMHDGITVNAILRFQGGRWTLVDHAIGPTDVWYCGIDGPPRSLTGC